MELILTVQPFPGPRCLIMWVFLALCSPVCHREHCTEGAQCFIHFLGTFSERSGNCQCPPPASFLKKERKSPKTMKQRCFSFSFSCLMKIDLHITLAQVKGTVQRFSVTLPRGATVTISRFRCFHPPRKTLLSICTQPPPTPGPRTPRILSLTL